ncbi:MAG: lytic murein transglycosylase B [Gammaproteobacteria bacterium]|nr:lytic murein transglycosylase B [Gammaproteobacteria bacterium]
MLVIALVTGIALWSSAAHGDYSARPEVAEYVDGLVAEHGFDRTWLEEVFSGATKSESVIDSISRPAEKVLAWHEYRAIFLTDNRIDGGVTFWKENAKAIADAERRFGVAGEVVVAIIGVETLYGRYLGSHRVIDALATLAFDYPRRAAFFKRELTEFLLLVREEGKDPLAPMGSYAGAMGYGQFISSSYRNFAIDFDGDGKRDIWTNRSDAVGSVANYLARHRWHGQGPAVVRVDEADAGILELVQTDLGLKHTVGEFRKRGAPLGGALDDTSKAALFAMEADDGTEYWLGLNDFHVITRYNRSAMYALAVLQLSQEIRRRFDAESG